MYFISSVAYSYRQYFENLEVAKEKAASIKNCDIFVAFKSNEEIPRIICFYSNGELLYEKH